MKRQLRREYAATAEVVLPKLMLALSLLVAAVALPASSLDAPIEIDVAVEKGTPLPGHEGLFVSPSRPLLGGDGALAFEAGFDDSKGRRPSGGVLRIRPGEPLEVLAMEGDPAPVGASTLDYVALLGFNAAGDVLLEGQALEGPADFERYFLGPGPGGALDLLAYDGGPAPGLGAGETFYLIHSTQFGDDGSFAFESLAEASGVVSTSKPGLWRSLPDTGLAALLLAGDPAPGMPLRALETIGDLAMDRAGNLGFVATLAPFGSGSVVLFLPDGSGGFAPAISSDQPAPGVPGNWLCGIRNLALAADFAAFASFVCGVTGHPDDPSGVWGGRVDQLALVAREGDEPAGFPPGYRFDEFGTVAVNGSGAIAFQASVSGRKVHPRFNQGIWTFEPGAGLRLVAFPGMKLAGRRKVRLLSMRVLGMTERGDVMFVSNLTNGGGAVHVAPAGAGGFFTLVAKGDKVELSPGRTVKVKDVAVWQPFQLPVPQGANVFDDEWRFALRLELGRGRSAAVVARPALGLRRAFGRDLESSGVAGVRDATVGASTGSALPQ